ncbi:hypothetical protein PC120_g13200 [Phytophthora cactorum]|nr:hypothetical protein PC120_g13200 [Phytophthora cactorum]
MTNYNGKLTMAKGRKRPTNPTVVRSEKKIAGREQRLVALERNASEDELTLESARMKTSQRERGSEEPKE